MTEQRLSAAKIAAIYLLTGALWILFSDRLLSALSDDPAVLARLGTLKGWFYVLVTAGLLYLLIRRHEAALLRAGESLERRVVERTRELATLLTVSHTVVSTLELEPLLDIILEQLQKVVDFSSASVFIREGEEVALKARHGRFSRDDAGSIRVAVRHPLARAAVLDQKTMVIEDTLGEAPAARDFRAWARGYAQATPTVLLDELLRGIRSWMGVPLVVKGRTIGLVTLSHPEPGRFSPREVRLVNAFAAQAAVAIENARLYEQAERLAVVEERQRLARELHDSVTQALYSVNLYAEAARLALDSEKPDAALKNLEQVRNMAREAVVDMRLLIFELRPPALEEGGLPAAIQSRLDAVETRAGLGTELQVEGERHLPAAVEEELFWITQEALNNVVKHAGARQVTISLAYSDAGVGLHVQDDGVGFDLEQAQKRGGMGLRSIKERVERIQGELEIVSQPGKGTGITVHAQVSQIGKDER
jgi:signal transduction histidine kinase